MTLQNYLVSDSFSNSITIIANIGPSWAFHKYNHTEQVLKPVVAPDQKSVVKTSHSGIVCRLQRGNLAWGIIALYYLVEH